jgi:hypothetical protein
VRNWLQNKGCVDCSEKRTIYIDACVRLDDIPEDKEYYYCKEHATKWFLTYAKTGNVVTLKFFIDLPTYYHYTEVRHNIYPESYRTVPKEVSANNCNLNYQNDVECHKVCGAAKCTNNFVRQFRKDQPTKCFVRIVSEKLGVGVFSSEKIGNNETIIEFNGEVFPFPVVQTNVQKALRAKDDYLYSHQLDENHWIDADYDGNISRFINHSCNPNAKLKYWTVRNLVGTLSNIYIYFLPLLKKKTLMFSFG